MCGFIFSYDDSISIQEKKDIGHRSLSLINHRGPDDSNLHVTDNVLMGHCRLSIIDVNGSAQPMSDPTGRYTLVFNGEIYNYKELRKQLDGEWVFKSDGDTEVLLAILVLKKHQLIKAMEGMWSYAFWDKRDKKLLVSRDRIGKKPAYYYVLNETIIVASEITALVSLINGPIEEDLDSTADFFRYGYYLPGTTAYKNIKEVLPGHILTWSLSELSQASYWELATGSYSGSKESAIERTAELLVEATKKRMVSDVEVGAFLSGGIDSSLIVSIMTKSLKITPKTFTIGFSDGRYDESSYASQIANIYKTDHYEEILSEFKITSLNDLILNHVCQPFSDSSLLPTALVSQLASKYVKVALSGDGGDELFCGYQRYQARTILRWYTRLPSIIRQNFEKLIKQIPEPFTHHSSSLIKKAHLFVDITNRIDDENPYIAPVMYTRSNYLKLAPDLASFGHEPSFLPRETQLDDIQEMMLSDALVYLPQDILLKVDRASMANSLETRAPFLDSKLIEHAFTLPSNWHKGLWKGKKILRQAFKEYLPNNIWERRKQGFAVPVHKWFKEGLSNELISLSLDIKSPVNTKYIDKLVNEHAHGHRDHGHRLWALYTYFIWKQKTLQSRY